MSEKELSYHEKLERPCHICGAHRWEYCSVPNMNEGVHHERGNPPKSDEEDS